MDLSETVAGTCSASLTKAQSWSHQSANNRKEISVDEGYYISSVYLSCGAEAGMGVDYFKETAYAIAHFKDGSTYTIGSISATSQPTGRSATYRLGNILSSTQIFNIDYIECYTYVWRNRDESWRDPQAVSASVSVYQMALPWVSE